MPEPITIGLLGFGRIAERVHWNVLQNLADVRVTALAEQAPERQEAARRSAPGIRIFSDYRTLLEKANVDAVLVCLPSALHAEAAVAAFAAGKHVYLEKPIATRMEDARRVLDAQDRAGTVGMVGFNFRFSELYRQARSIIRSGRLGELVGVRSVFAAAARPLPPWKQTRAGGGGALLDLASHHADLIPFLFDEHVAEVSCALRSQNTEGDSAIWHLHMSSGMLVQSLFSINAVAEDRFEIYGDAGKLTLDRYAGALTVSDPHIEYSRPKRCLNALVALGKGLRRALRPPGEPSFRNALHAFATAVRTGRPVRPDLEDGYRSLALLDAAEQSSRTRQTVQLQVDAVAAL